jgi:hypothetical protein
MIAIGALVLAMAASTSAVAGSDPAVTVRAVTVSGNEVAITVANHAARAQSGIVKARVLMGGRAVRVMAPVTAAVGQTATIRIVLPAAVEDVLPAGVVVDDGVPF